MPEITIDGFVLFFGYDSIYSNFRFSPISIDGNRFNSMEQFYQWSKASYFGDTDMAEAILNAKFPRQQKALAYKIRNFCQSKWDTVKVDIMKRGVLAKFEQNSHLKLALLATENKEFVECSKYDCFWGNGLLIYDLNCVQKDEWKGGNNLGKILGETREILREK